MSEDKGQLANMLAGWGETGITPSTSNYISSFKLPQDSLGTYDFNSPSSNNGNLSMDSMGFGSQGNGVYNFGDLSAVPNSRQNGWFDSLGSFGKNLKGAFNAETSNGASKMFGTGGWAGALGSLATAGGGIASAVMAGKQAKLGRDIYDFQKAAYNQDNLLQSKQLNRAIEKDARNEMVITQGAPRGYDSLEEYTNKWFSTPQNVG